MARQKNIQNTDIEKILKLLQEKNIELENTKQVLGQQIQELDTTAKMLVKRDLELTLANEKLSELDHIKSEFITVIAHQLRTPLSALKWTLKMLLDEDLGPVNKDQKEYIIKGYHTNERLITIVNDILHANKIETGKSTYIFYPVRIEELIEDVIKTFATIVKKNNKKITFRRAPQFLPKVKIDASKIRQVLENIFDNAIKYSLTEGEIIISLQQNDTFVTITVSDNGIGIPKDEQPNIFSRFFRAKNAMKDETEGTGLGLYIAKEIIKKHKGTIDFESNEKKGTNFFITLPIYNK